jgi:protein arginine N-methyltransferase 5
VILQGLSEGGSERDVESSENVVETHKYLNYVARLFQSKPAHTPQEQFELPYHDYLQAPLQPLQDNLESQTYETFEKDPVKYVRYEDAIFRCLQHKIEAGKQSVAAIVVGAGRGPLVVAVRSAAARAKVDARIWAVEKNPNAVITLKHRSKLENWDNVEVVSEDMRFWEAPQKADLVVSELLGSFGDNELSPECLDGAQRFLAPDGVCIPSSYTSFLTPVTTAKLWNDVKNYSDLAHFETAYVVKFHQAFYPSKEIKPCFTFSHPNWELKSNDRYAEIDFTAEVEALVHGFAGYFHCQLYEEINVSINPDTYSAGMFSWFPIYFPLRTPVLIKEGQRLKSHWWRCSNSKKVWYEWVVSEPTPQPMHNPSGRSYYIGK